MKHTLIRSILISSCFILLFSVAGCGKDKDKSSPADTGTKEADSGLISWSDTKKDDSDDVSSDGKDNGRNKDGILSGIRDKSGKADVEQIKAAYMDFLADKELAVADISENEYFREGNRYSFSEIIDMYIRNESVYFDGGDIGLTDALYSYIDCGNDGIPEMAVQLTYMLNGDFNRVYFFNYRDGEVHLIGSDEWGYRSIMDLNRLGYVINGGSGGAVLWVNDHYYFDAEGQRSFLYNFEQYMGLKTPRIPKYYMKNGDTREDYPDDEFEEGSYMAYIYNFDEYIYDENDDHEATYDKYYSKNIYCFLDEKERDVEPDDRFKELYRKEGIKWYKLDEIKKLVEDHEAALGVTDEIRNAEPAKWESIADLGIMEYPLANDKNGAYGDNAGEEPDNSSDSGRLGPYYSIYNDHPKPYQSTEANMGHSYTPITLKEISCKENEITDTDRWFEETGTTQPGTTYSDDRWWYELTGDKGYGTMTVLNIYEKENYSLMYTVDLSDFLYEPGYENKDYVDRGIHYCKIGDNYLYLNLYHRTYAQDCPENAYLICIDITSGEVIWISDPLVSNSCNFVIWGDNIITGYGFTAENDYIYLINRYNGKTMDRVKVKKSPDYFAVVNNRLWVRTYSYDYVFSVK